MPAPAEIVVHGDLGPLAPLVLRLKAAGVAVREQAGDGGEPSTGPGIELPGLGVLRLTDGRLATAVAADVGHPVVLVDLALDAGTTTRFAVAPSDGCPERTLDAATGLLQVAGATVSVVGDVPGLLVARTVAMLVNEAADLVARGVATAEDIDLAMRHGVNYPAGPLEWGERLGAGYVVRVLDNLAAVYGDGRYRAVPALRRRSLSLSLREEDS